MERIPFEEWKSKAEQLGNGETTTTPFKCPQCGNVATKRQFIEAGAEGHRVATNCIGRVVSNRGCDWAAFGLLGTMGKGVIVVMEDGSEQEVFPFAEETSA